MVYNRYEGYFTVRTILHSDLNNFYASVELLRRPELRGKPVIVTGSKEDRHGIVLAKNDIAKRMGVKTGEVCWQARNKCGNELKEVSADFPTYSRVSQEIRKIYAEYTDKIEPFGIDECWLDVTHSVNLFGGGREIAEILRSRIKRETGLTVSIGVSFNKIFAKLGSDMKKPDAVTEITEDNFRTLVWRLPVQDLLFVGNATREKLNRIGIRTIGELAAAPQSLLQYHLGKWGIYLHEYANGRDNSPVTGTDEEDVVKSVGNSLTLYHDLTDEEDVETVLFMLADSVSSRMREAGLPEARTVKLWVRCNDLSDFTRQGAVNPTDNAVEIGKRAFQLFRECYTWEKPVRALGVSVTNFCYGAQQLDLFHSDGKSAKLKKLEFAIDSLRGKYGNSVIRSALILRDPRLAELDLKNGHLVHSEEPEKV